MKAKIIIIITLLFANSVCFGQFMYGVPSDKIRDYLSTSLIDFDNAATGEFVQITAAEYNYIKDDVSSVGHLDSLNGTSVNFAPHAIVAPLINAPANTYLIALAIEIDPSATMTINIRKHTGSGRLGGANGYSNIGSISATSGPKTVYIILKNSSLETAIHWYAISYSTTSNYFRYAETGKSYAAFRQDGTAIANPFSFFLLFEVNNFKLGFEYLYTSKNLW